MTRRPGRAGRRTEPPEPVRSTGWASSPADPGRAVRVVQRRRAGRRRPASRRGSHWTRPRQRGAAGLPGSATGVRGDPDRRRWRPRRRAPVRQRPLAMLCPRGGSLPPSARSAEFEWDVAPLPVFNEQVGILHSDAYCITKASSSKDAAWRFIEYALGEAGARASWLGRAGRFRRMIKVSTSSAFLDPAASRRPSQVFLDAIPTVRSVAVDLDLAGDRGRHRQDPENGLYTATRSTRSSPNSTPRPAPSVRAARQAP